MGETPALFSAISPSSRSPMRIGAVLLMMLAFAGCGVINVGKFKGVERTDSDEQYYLVKETRLLSSSSARPKDHFDHSLDDTVNLMFVPANEKNQYISKTIWYDPSGQEYRTIRQSHDKAKENPEALQGPKRGTSRIHTMPLLPMWKHKPGMWTVELYLDGQLARRLEFHVR